MIYVLDASALLALARGERGADVVQDLLQNHECVASSVNMAEVGAKLIDLGLPESELARALHQFDVGVLDFNLEHATTSAALRTQTKSVGLSLGDRACLALARHMEATAVTADSAWLDVAEALHVKVLMVR